MANLRRSLFINFFSSSGAALLKFITSVLVARILSPSEIGVFSMTLVLVNIAHIFRDFGVSGYIQRESDLTPIKVRSAFGVALVSSWLIASILFAVSGAIGAWFDEPQMVPVLHVLSVGFLLIPFASIANALLMREFAADKQAWVAAVGTISYCGSCVLLAQMGFGSLSLAYANLINIIACILVFIPLRPEGLLWTPVFRHWRGIAQFGLGSLISNCAVALNNAIPDILLGKLDSAYAVGLLSRATSTVQIFTHVAGDTVNYGSVSYLARAYHNGEPLAPLMTRAVAMLTGVGWSALALTTVLRQEIMLALYGPSWLESVPAIPPLSLAAGIMMLFHFSPMALTAIGRPYLGAMPVVVTLLTRIAFGVALFDGNLVTFAWAFCFATMAAVPIMAYQQSHYFDLTIRKLIHVAWPSLLVALVCGAAAEVARFVLPASLPAMVKLCIMAAPLALVWYAGLRLTRHELLFEVHRALSVVRAKFLRK